MSAQALLVIGALLTAPSSEAPKCELQRPLRLFGGHVLSGVSLPQTYGGTLCLEEAPETLDAVGVLAYRGQAICSGTLIGPRVVLTAAHCIKDKDYRQMTFLIGSDPGRPEDRIDIRDGEIHEDYDPTASKANDLAALYLKRAAKATPLPLRTDPVPAVQQLLFVGFGEASPTRKRRCFNMPVEASCGATFSSDVPDRAACVGDSGGPALERLIDGYRVAGVMSWGDEACSFSVSTDVSAYRYFLTSVLYSAAQGGDWPRSPEAAHAAALEAWDASDVEALEHLYGSYLKVLGTKATRKSQLVLAKEQLGPRIPARPRVDLFSREASTHPWTSAVGEFRHFRSTVEMRAGTVCEDVWAGRTSEGHWLIEHLTVGLALQGRCSDLEELQAAELRAEEFFTRLDARHITRADGRWYSDWVTASDSLVESATQAIRQCGCHEHGITLRTRKRTLPSSSSPLLPRPGRFVRVDFLAESARKRFWEEVWLEKNGDTWKVLLFSRRPIL